MSEQAATPGPHPEPPPDPATAAGDPFSGLAQTPAARKRHRRRTFWIILAIALVAAAVAAYFIVPWRGTVSTDDAFIDGTIVQIAPNVAGRILRVYVDDNQKVRGGDLLLEIDPRDYQARVDEAKAALALAQAHLQSSQSTVELTQRTTGAGVEQAQAEVTAAQANVARAQAEQQTAASEAQQAEADLARYLSVDIRAVSAQQVDVARTAAQTARARVEAAQRQVAAARADVAAAQGRLASAQAAPYQVAVSRADVQRAQAEIAQAQAALARAELDLSYTRLTAPIDGRITRKAVDPGDYAQVGQALMALVSSDLWVQANFKETQLTRIRAGQHASIEVDAYPGVTFPAHVDSVQAGSGAWFSLLPPENATGNYVKVVQRVPVKIVFDQPPELDRYHLGPGMSVIPRVRIR